MPITEEVVVKVDVKTISCPICNSESNFFKSFDDRILYLCPDCETLFFDPIIPLYPYGISTVWAGCKWQVERNANLIFQAELLWHANNIVRWLTNDRDPGSCEILEVGSKYGLLLDMARLIYGWNVVGMDPHVCGLMGSVDLGYELIPELLQDSADGQRFDVIISNQVLEHDHDPVGFVHALPGRLKPDGFVFLIMPNAAMKELGADYSPEAHATMLSPRSIVKLLNDAGLQHHVFVNLSVSNQMGIIAGFRPIEFNNSGESDRSHDIAATKSYLEQRIQSKGLPSSLEIGLRSRLFELLVSNGDYAGAERVLGDLERAMGIGDGANWTEFVNSCAAEMAQAKDLLSYAASGPGSLAPYLFWKGMLCLNYTGDFWSAAECFNLAERLFKHEVYTIGLSQFEQMIYESQRHATLARSRSEQSDFRYRPSQISSYGSPAMCGVLLGEGRQDIEITGSGVRRVSIKGGQSFVFDFHCDIQHLSGLTCDVAIKPKLLSRTIRISLSIFEEFNPVEIRKTEMNIACNDYRTKAFGAFRFSEPILFRPIPDSAGKRYKIALSISPNASRASLLCAKNRGGKLIAWNRRIRDKSAVLIPYYSGVSRTESGAPLVSCLIVTYNSEKYIKACLDSIADQHYPNVEIVIIDNASTDQTGEIIRQTPHKVNLKVLDSNVHFSEASNLGVSCCNGDLICVLNPDISLTPGALERFVDHFGLSDKIAIVGCNISTKGSLLRYADVFLINGLISSGEDYLQRAVFCAAACGAGFMVRKSVVEELGYLFDSGFKANWEDHDLGLRCWLHGYYCLHIPELGLYHVGGGSYGLVDPKRDVMITRNALLTYFKNFEGLNFIAAFLKTILRCRNVYRFIGIVQFLFCFWKYIPARISLQKKRRISDRLIRLMTSRITAYVR